MDAERAANYLDTKFRIDHNLPDDEIVDYGGIGEHAYFIQFVSDAIHNIEQNHKDWGMPCMTCMGTGGVTYTENQSPLGSGMYWPMEMGEPCPECSEIGVCPKCGYNMDFNEDTAIQTCSRCGYVESDGDQ